MSDLDVRRPVLPAVVIRRQSQGRKTNLRFAGQFSLLQIGHADHIRPPATVKMRLRAGGKLRPFHAEIGPPRVNPRAFSLRAVDQPARKLLAKGIRQAHVGDDALAEKAAWPMGRAVDELVRYDNMAGFNLLAQTPDGADGHDPLDAELFHRENVGAKIDFGGQPAMPLAVARQKYHLGGAELASNEFIGRFPEGGFHLHLADLLKPFHLVDAAAADDPEDRRRRLFFASHAVSKDEGYRMTDEFHPFAFRLHPL